jgi:hypothetical protein
MVLSIFCFGSLAYFIDGKYEKQHVVLIYSVITFWPIVEILLAYHVGTFWFILLTWVFATIPAIIAFWSLFMQKISVIVQLLCVSFTFSWLLIFITKFL